MRYVHDNEIETFKIVHHLTTGSCPVALPYYPTISAAFNLLLYAVAGNVIFKYV